jgi:hypothetical protein
MSIRSDGGFEAMLVSMRELATNGLPMTSAAARVEEFMRGTLKKRQTPEGDLWPLTDDGKPALAGAADAYEQNVVGKDIVMKVGGGEKKRYAIHNFGAGYQKVRRQLPKGKIPQKLGNAIRAGLVDDFKAITMAGKVGYAKMRAKGLKITKVPR